MSSSRVTITCLQPDVATLATMENLVDGQEVYNPTVVPFGNGHQIVAFGYGGFGLDTYLTPSNSSDAAEWVAFPGEQWDESRQWDESAAPSYSAPWGDFGLTDDEFAAANQALYMALSCTRGG